MKKHVRNHVFIFILLVIFSFNAKSQEVIRLVPCFDSTLKAQADSLKLSLIKQGFVVVKEATMKMESEYEMPVIVPLNRGSWYQFVFIGDMTSKLYELRMYDDNEKEVVFERHFGNGMESNIISYSYIPKFSELHMIKPVQVNRKKKGDICGYILILKRVK